MGNWSFDITRQAAWDVWTLVCAAASAVLVGYAALGGPSNRRARAIRIGSAALAVLGTSAVLAIPALRSAGAGLVWTFLLLAQLSATLYLNLLDRLSTRRMATLLTLRLLALLALVPMLFEPVVRLTRPWVPQRPVLFLIDASGSMSFPDVQNGPTRLQSAWQALQPNLPRLRQRLVPRFFTFSTDLIELRAPEQLARAASDGTATDLVRAVTSALSSTTREDAALVLLSDGIDNVSPDVLGPLAASRHPIYTVAVGSESAESSAIANVAIADVTSTDDWSVGHDATVAVTIRSSALNDRVVEVKLAPVDAGGNVNGPVASQQLVLKSQPDGQKLEMKYRPPAAGAQRLAVWVDPVAGERSVEDNRQVFQGLAVDPRIKVLYIEGRLRPEFRELRRLLERDPNVELATLLRLQQTRFAASGTVDGQPLPPQLPTTPEAWRRFDVIFLGDLEAGFLSQAQQAALEQRVADGGALLMLGGQKSFGAGGYKGTPIERALPVFVGDLTTSQEPARFLPRLTAEGDRHPAMEGLGPWFGSGDKPGERPLPPLNGHAVVGAEKSGAAVLLTHVNDAGPGGKPQVVLAVQLYGKGRSAALTVYSTYQWALPLAGLGQDSPYNRLWGQLVRWLAGADVRGRGHGPGVEALLNKSVYALGEGVRVRASVRDGNGDATAFAQVSLTLRQAGATAERSLTLTPAPAGRGMYELTIPPLEQGEYTAALVAAKDGRELGRQAVKFAVTPPADELLKLAANPALLRAIAQRTGGSHYDLSRLPELIEELIRTDAATPKARPIDVRLANFAQAAPTLVGRHPAWDRKYDLPMQAILVVALLAAEWTLRRRWLFL